MGKDGAEGSAGEVDNTAGSQLGQRNGLAKDDAPPQSEQEHRLWRFRMRADNDDGPQDWWFAAMAIPLLAAGTGPLANMLSIAGLVTSWRSVIPNNGAGRDQDSVGFPDPHWCIALNVASLVCGFAGNFLLLLNFTRRVPYIIALPTTIILWYFATAILISITASMHIHVPPIRPQQTYSQGFWYAVIAAILYLLSSMALMINMLGYFLGHYPRHFVLTDHQRTLILQTMMFIVWLAGGAAVFSRICGWSFVDALYFADVTILTIGFGDLYAPNDAGRGVVFPFSIGGIVMLGLVVNSIHKFMAELSNDNVFKKHVERQRVRTVGRSVTRSIDLPTTNDGGDGSGTPIPQPSRTTELEHVSSDETSGSQTEREKQSPPGHSLVWRLTNSKVVRQVRPHKPKIILLKEEKDRFDAMRHLQHRAHKFRRWYNLSTSVIAFALLWCLGAVVFFETERREQGLSYFQALYFCYVSLLTIGYGDLSPKSNAGKPFFVLWSLVAVPTMTILIGDMAGTVIASFNRGTFVLADWTVLPKAGLWRSFLNRNPWLLLWLQRKAAERAVEKRIEEGFRLPDDEESPPTLEQLAQEGMNEHHHARRLAAAIRRTARDIRVSPPKRYRYEEWVEFTRLIRFSRENKAEVEHEEETEGMIYWDWIGEDSPMMADMGEPEWVLERLCESMDRFIRLHYGPHVGRKSRKRANEETGASDGASETHNQVSQPEKERDTG